MLTKQQKIAMIIEELTDWFIEAFINTAMIMASKALWERIIRAAMFARFG